MAELTDTQVEYVEWRAEPNRSGTKREWAQAHGLKYQTLRDWEKTAWYRESFDELLEEMAVGRDSMLEVAVTLQKSAALGDQTAIRQYMAMVEKINPTRVAPREDRSVESMTDDELDAAWAEARAV